MGAPLMADPYVYSMKRMMQNLLGCDPNQAMGVRQEGCLRWVVLSLGVFPRCLSSLGYSLDASLLEFVRKAEDLPPTCMMK